MNRKEYNGYTNYETWAVALWLDNEQETHEAARTMTAEAWDDSEFDTRVPQPWTRSDAARYGLADRLKAWTTNDLLPDLGATLAADLLGAAVSEVDWDDIADNYLSDHEAAEGYEARTRVPS